MNRQILRALASVGTLLLAMLLFFLCYRFDNKYTVQEPVGQNGLLILDEETLSKHSVLHLIHGWEIFPGALLAPEEITAALPRIVAAIGEYGGFEFGDRDRSPHGSATYRFNILLPDEPRSYALELPEIYSAYKLYINGSLVRQMGNPDPEDYRPYTGNSSVTFTAAKRAEIVIAVTDFSHFYSGLVYPPAFGEPVAVMKLLNTRFALRMLLCTLALMAGLYYLVTGLLAARKKRLSILYGLLCLCFVGSTAYPIRGVLWPGGMTWYGFENFCYCAMFLLVLLICSCLEQRRSTLTTVFLLFGGAVCCVALVMPHIVGDSLTAISVYSKLIGAYAWISAVSLTLILAHGLIRGARYNGLMMAGILIFDAALIMDRLLPLHEPILLGWFVELAGATMVFFIGLIAAQESVRASRERLVLESRIDSVTKLIDMQRDYYPVLLSSIEQSRALHHDLRHHLRLINGYLAEGDLEALRAHLDEYAAGLTHAPVSFTRNLVIDTILRQFAALCNETQVRFETQIDAPDALAMHDGDLAVLLGNLLENALEASMHVTPERRFISVTLMYKSGWLYIELSNCFDGYIRSQGARVLSRKRGGSEGIGLASVKTIAARYEGDAFFLPDSKTNLYHSRVTLRVEEPS